MNEEQNTGSVLDVLTEDLSSVNTDFPILVEGLYDLKVHDIKDEPSADGTKLNLVIQLHTTEPANTVTRDVQNAGFTLFCNISLTATEKNTAAMIKRRVAEFTQAVGVPAVKPYENVKGRIVRAKVIVDPERRDPVTGKQYDARNSIKAFLKV